MLSQWPADSVDCCVTSPPYWGLRDYGAEGQLGLEPTPAEYIARLVAIFEEVRRVLKPTGTLWLNLGDSYCSSGGHADRDCNERRGAYNVARRPEHEQRDFRASAPGLKPKDLCLIPARVAIALQEAGWWLRSEIVWAKPNPMPESVKDRPTSAHEKIFLLTKRGRGYFFDAAAIAEPVADGTVEKAERGVFFGSQKGGFGDEFAGSRLRSGNAYKPGRKGNSFARQNSKRGIPQAGANNGSHRPGRPDVSYDGPLRNSRNVWSIATRGFKEAHFATFPPELPRRCIAAGCPPGGIVLDPFLGSGTTARVAAGLGRDWLGVELNPEYIALAQRRINNGPLFALADSGLRTQDSAPEETGHSPALHGGRP